MTLQKRSFRFTYQWVLFEQAKTIRHAFASQLQPTEQEQKELEGYPAEFAKLAEMSVKLKRTEVVGEYNSEENMGHAFWLSHFKGAAAEDIAKIVAAVPDWGRRIGCSVCYSKRTEHVSTVIEFVEPKPFVEVAEGQTITADTIRELVDKTYERIPITDDPGILVSECSFLP